MSLPDTGKWIVSLHEEHWDVGEEFDTKEEAIAYALGHFAEEHDLEEGATVFVGQVEAITAAQMAEYAIDATRILEDVDEMLYERVGDEVNHELDVKTPQGEDLERRLRETFVRWCADHQIAAPCFSVEKVSRHQVPATDVAAHG